MKYEEFRVASGGKFDLKKHRTDATGAYTEKQPAKRDLETNTKRLAELQEKLYAQNVHALLVIFQAMDAAGKDGTIQHVLSGVNPQGCHVVSFKQPSAEELDHDYLWRSMRQLPERGKIGIFNRSYYEEVLVVRVHPEVFSRQQLPEETKNDKRVWERRFREIRHFEDYLTDNGVQVLKFFLNVSKAEQKKRFLSRIEEPEKHWKFSAADVRERRFWDDYQRAYAEAIAATASEKSPWFVIPADNKWFMRTAVSEIICQRLESMNLNYPQISALAMKELLEAKTALEAED